MINGRLVNHRFLLGVLAVFLLGTASEAVRAQIVIFRGSPADTRDLWQWSYGWNTYDRARNLSRYNNNRYVPRPMSGYVPYAATYYPKVQPQTTVSPALERTGPAGTGGTETAQAVSAQSVEPDPDVLVVWDRIGAVLRPVASQLVQRVAPAYQQGMEIAAVKLNSPAARSGWRKGDVLIGLYRYQIKSYSDAAFVATMPDFTKLDSLLAILIRDGKVLHTTLDLKPSRS